MTCICTYDVQSMPTMLNNVVLSYRFNQNQCLMKQTLHELGSNKNIFSTWVDIQVFWNEINESLIIYFDCVNKTVLLFMANSNQTIHRKWNCWSLTHVKMHNLFRVDENSLEQCCAAHIVQCCQQYCSVLLHLIAG